MSAVTTPKAKVSPTSRSPLSELLVLPACTTPKRKKDPPKSARVLTSAQSLEILVQKEQKKKEEQEEKERKKLEREQKRQQKEREKAQKQQEKQAKKAEMEAKKAEKEAEKRRKMEEREKKKAEKRATKPTKQYPMRRSAEKENVEPERHGASGDVCTVCCGAYSDDIDDDGEVSADWIQCTEVECGVWSHVDCLEREARGFVCASCFSIFN